MESVEIPGMFTTENLFTIFIFYCASQIELVVYVPTITKLALAEKITIQSFNVSDVSNHHTFIRY